MNIARLRGTRAFTLIELIVVIVIMGILVAVGAFAYNAVIKSSQKKAVELTAHQVAKSVQAYSATTGTPYGPDIDIEKILNGSAVSFDTTPGTIAGPDGTVLSPMNADGDFTVAKDGQIANVDFPAGETATTFEVSPVMAATAAQPAGAFTPPPAPTVAPTLACAAPDAASFSWDAVADTTPTPNLGPQQSYRLDATMNGQVIWTAIYDTTSTGDLMADPNVQWSQAPFDAPVTVTVRVVDVYGGVGPVSNTRTFFVDSTQPGPPYPTTCS